MAILFDSPLTEWTLVEDQKNFDKDPAWYYDYYCVKLFKKAPNFVYSLLLKDWEFRADNQLSVVASTEGELGTGKSLGTLALALKNSEIFLKPLAPENILVSKAMASMLFRTAEPRSTFLVDEQDRKSVGLMANTIDMDLLDFEIQGRYTQTNMFWISREVITHPHTFVFETEKVNRVSNPKCNDCPFYRECKVHKYDTLCRIDEKIKKKIGLTAPVKFNERSGYPISFEFILKTKRKGEGLFPRGRLLIPMVEAETAKKYDEIKQKIISRMQNMDNEGMDLINLAVDQVLEKAKDLLLVHSDVEIGRIDKQKITICFARPAPAYQIQSAIFSVHGLNKFPQKAIPLIAGQIRQKLLKMSFDKNAVSIENAKRDNPGMVMQKFRF